jgi:hypothetical protein
LTAVHHETNCLFFSREALDSCKTMCYDAIWEVGAVGKKEATVGYWHVYCGGRYLGRIWAWGRECALRIARHTYGHGRAYHVTRDCEGQ